RSYFAADSHRRQEPNLVEPVIDPHHGALHPHSRALRTEVGQHREREKTVGDGTAKLGFLCSLRVDVDELMVFGYIRKAVHPVLGDFEPVGNAGFLADIIIQFFFGNQRHRSVLTDRNVWAQSVVTTSFPLAWRFCNTLSASAAWSSGKVC